MRAKGADVTEDAFGNIINQTHSGTPTPNEYLGFGERQDVETSLYYLRARYMNSTIGRFQTADDFEGNSYAPSSLHRYLYVGDDPLNKFDPTGRFTLIEGAACVAIAAAVFGTVTALWKHRSISSPCTPTKLVRNDPLNPQRGASLSIQLYYSDEVRQTLMGDKECVVANALVSEEINVSEPNLVEFLSLFTTQGFFSRLFSPVRTNSQGQFTDKYKFIINNRIFDTEERPPAFIVQKYIFKTSGKTYHASHRFTVDNFGFTDDFPADGLPVLLGAN